jgi:hypothetical protein
LIIEGATMSAAVIQVTSAAKVLAELRGRNMVKDHIRRQGYKVSAYKSAEITEWARLYVADHPELQAQCLEEAKKMILAGLLGKRAQKALRAKIESDAQASGSCFEKTISVQISGAK